MNGTVQLQTIDVTVPANKVSKIRSIADRMRFEAGHLTYDEYKGLEQFRCCSCGKPSLDGTQTDIGFICKECNSE